MAYVEYFGQFTSEEFQEDIAQVWTLPIGIMLKAFNFQYHRSWAYCHVFSSALKKYYVLHEQMVTKSYIYLLLLGLVCAANPKSLSFKR